MDPKHLKEFKRGCCKDSFFEGSATSAVGFQFTWLNSLGPIVSWHFLTELSEIFEHFCYFFFLVVPCYNCL